MPDQPTESDRATQHTHTHTQAAQQPTEVVPLRSRRQGQTMSAAEKKIAQATFLEVLKSNANVREAAEAVGIDHSTVYRWKDKDKKFAELFDAANEFANWRLFGEAWKRALEGEVEVMVSMGRVVYEEIPVLDDDGEPVLDKRGNPQTRPGKPMTIRKKSDRLLEFMMKHRIPEFSDKQTVEHTGLTDMVAGAQQSLLAALSKLPEVVPANADQDKEQDSSSAAGTL